MSVQVVDEDMTHNYGDEESKGEMMKKMVSFHPLSQILSTHPRSKVEEKNAGHPFVLDKKLTITEKKMDL